jgi:glycolate oxidase
VREPGVLDRVLAAGKEILSACIDAGGTITGEHGVGMEKPAFMPLIFSADDLGVMAAVRSAVDPSGLFNPAKVLPTPDRHAPPLTTTAAVFAGIPQDVWV